MALRVAYQEILDGIEANSEVKTVRGWKLFLVLPRMMLFRPDRGGPMSRKKLEARVRWKGHHLRQVTLPRWGC